MTSLNPRFVILAILDGWGLAVPGPSNAITQAKTVNMNKFTISYPHGQLQASGQAVGLPRNEAGNTETGHLNLGAGKIIYQDLERINMSIAEGTFFTNATLLGAIKHAEKYQSNLHLMGLIGAGGVHSNIEHLFALIQMASKNNFKDIYLHLFTDGRDSPPTSAKVYITKIREVLDREKKGKIASVMGRYWAMDRDQRWERIERAYNALTKGLAQIVKTPEEAVELSYANGQTDEFIEPSIIVDDKNKPLAMIKDNDSVIFFNFRIDRPRELTKAFVLDDFAQAYTTYNNEEKSKKRSPEPFKRGKKIENLYFVTMTEYSKEISDCGAKTAFPPEIVDQPIGSIIAQNNLRQLRITESEKERFVTFYFNGLRDNPFPLEERVIIPSPKVLTYDQKPEMSAIKITETLLEKIKDTQYSFVVVNYPNADMVGHTGNIGPTVKAVEVVDDCIGKLSNFVLAYNGVLVITADHGNAEEMINLQSGEIDTEHSNNPVPFIIIARSFLGKSQTLNYGILADVAPTILSLLNIPIPSGMTGRDLLKDVIL